MHKETQNSNDHIVFLGESGFPYGLAAVQRMTLMAKALLHVGLQATVICRKGVWKKNDQTNFSNQGIFEGIDYSYTSKSVFRPEGFINRNVQKLMGLFGEFKVLKNLKKHGKIDVAIISDMSVIHVFRYLIYSKLLNFPIVVNYVEMASSMQDRTFILTKVNDYLLDHYIIKLFDGALPISDKLMDHYKTIAPSKPRLKLPILCDFEKFNISKKKQEEPYFLYCGSMAYSEVIDFIIEAYKSIPKNENIKLLMIVSGGGLGAVNVLKKEINTSLDHEPIGLYSNIPYGQLVDLYTNATALLIPLRPTLQDSSRFPHKIGEYLASGNPIITTDVGEIKNYFEDGKTAFVAKTYSINSFAEKMQYVLNHPETSKEIGLNGKQLGMKEFDYKTQGSRLLQFLQELKNDT